MTQTDLAREPEYESADRGEFEKMVSLRGTEFISVGLSGASRGVCRTLRRLGHFIAKGVKI